MTACIITFRKLGMVLSPTFYEEDKSIITVILWGNAGVPRRMQIWSSGVYDKLSEIRNDVRIKLCIPRDVDSNRVTRTHTHTRRVYVIYMNKVNVIDRMNCTGQAMEIKRFGVRELLPDTKHYMTYDGSTTMPACHETTTWIILNKPIYITKQQASIATADCF